ncbi:hypothetical protein HY441_00150 [Candidatus Microgenomates bacterium]|nr:hypothetical protein [Candidatus Microgenomates bacterium]
MPKRASDKDYRDLGKSVAKILSKDYTQVAQNWKRLMWLSFVRGVLMGFGSVLGATILIGILLWLLNIFDALPWIGDFFRSTKETIQQ